MLFLEFLTCAYLYICHCISFFSFVIAHSIFNGINDIKVTKKVKKNAFTRLKKVYIFFIIICCSH